MLEHGINGTMIPKVALNRLGEAISEVLALPMDQRRSMQIAARKTVEERFSPTVEERALRAILQSLK